MPACKTPSVHTSCELLHLVGNTHWTLAQSAQLQVPDVCLSQLCHPVDVLCRNSELCPHVYHWLLLPMDMDDSEFPRWCETVTVTVTLQPGSANTLLRVESGPAEPEFCIRNQLEGAPKPIFQVGLVLRVT